MPLMTVFEPLLLLLILASVVTILAAAALAARGRFSDAGRVLGRWALCAVVYFTIVIIVSVFTPRREYRVGDTRCFDDWCIAVVSATRVDASTYEVSLRLSSRAKRRPMGERRTVLYLTDARGRRRDPRPDPTALGFDTILQPGESVLTTRRFDVPRDAGTLGLIYAHEGGFPGWFVPIIGEGGWLSKPDLWCID